MTDLIISIVSINSIVSIINTMLSVLSALFIWKCRTILTALKRVTPTVIGINAYQIRR